MWTAAMWGGISGTAVLLGALTAIFFPINRTIIGFIMAFGTGVLIGAVAYELLEEPVQEGGMVPVSIGFLAGAGIFTAFDYMVSRKGAHKRKRSDATRDGSKAGLAIFIGTVMDAIPESIMIGSSLTVEKNVSFLLVTAIFISNIPEGLSSTSGLINSGYSKLKVFFLWFTVMIISAISSWAGYFFLSDASDAVMAGIASFAGGGIIAMIGSTMMPEAYEDGGPVTGLIVALGLQVSLLLNFWSQLP
ncbi:ZIP family metal transporter [Peribacillus sp. SCS-155]|uniref:ZIP family metal transporter n=1 Tax=Peribacillus sedimenti TaxID=3115297 RepID=UPI003906CBAC